MYIAAVVNWYAGVFCLSVNERSGRPESRSDRQSVSGGLTAEKSLEFLSSISRLGIVRTLFGSALGLAKRFVFSSRFSRHGIARASAALLIWLNENVPLYASLNSAADGNLRGNSRNSGVLCFLRAAWFGSSLSKWRDCFFSGFYSRFIEKGAPLPIKHEKYRFLIQKDSEMRK